MPEQVDVYCDGWGEHWRWGTLAASNAITGRPLIAFEYSDEARRRGLELSAYTLKRCGLHPARIGPLERLSCIGQDQAMMCKPAST